MKSKKFLRRFKEASVTPRMLEEVTLAFNKAVRDAGGKLQEDPIWIVLDTFHGRDLGPWTITAIMFRMQALSDLVAAGKISEWQLSSVDKTGAVSLGTNVFEAASMAELILSDRRGVPPKFRLDEFKRLALAAVLPEGRG